MQSSVLALKAAKIALYTVDKISSGALSKVGASILELLKERFQGKLQISKTEPELLEAAILSEAELDENFKIALEALVLKYHRIQDSSGVSQTTESGVNQSISGNSGTVIGQQFFRQ
ncbi:MAG: hypothetical protein WA885_16840 [Phormidesmis sp.]